MKYLIALLFTAIACAQTTETTVADTVRVPINGQLVEGEVIITPSTSMTCGTNAYAPVPITQTITSGVLSVTLVPNSACGPVDGQGNPASYYTARFRDLQRGASWTETWVVPVSLTAVQLTTVRIASTVSALASVNPSQLLSGGATTGQTLIWDGSHYVPSDIGAATDHAQLSNRAYAVSGHTGFQAQEFVNLRDDYAAVCDGSDQWGPFATAIAAGKRRITLPAGCHLVVPWGGAAYEITSDTHIRGEGKTSVIRVADPSTQFLALGAGTILENLSTRDKFCRDSTDPVGVDKLCYTPFTYNAVGVSVTGLNWGRELSIFSGPRTDVDITGNPINVIDQPGMSIIQYGVGDGLYIGVRTPPSGLPSIAENGVALRVETSGNINDTGILVSSGTVNPSAMHTGVAIDNYADGSQSGSQVGLMVRKYGDAPGIWVNETVSTGSITQDAIAVVSNKRTTGQIINLYHDGSAMSAVGLLMNFAYGGGSYTGNFAQFKNNNEEAFYTGYSGRVGAAGGFHNLAPLTGVSKPTCDVSLRGLVWYTRSGDGVADTYERCSKDDLDAYGWTPVGVVGGGGGITSLGGQTGATQTFGNDTNVTMVSAANAHTLTWSGTLAKTRQNAATVYNDAGNTYTTGAQDFSAATNLKVPAGAGAAPTASGLIAYDTTANLFKAGVNGTGKTFAFTDSSITGNAGTATALQTARNIGGVSFNGTADIVPQLVQTQDSTDTTSFVAVLDSATGNQQVKSNSGLTFNSTTGVLTATGFVGPLTGNVTGNVTGSASLNLLLTGGTLTGQLITSNLGVRYTASDTNPTCIPGNGVYAIFADLSEGKLKKCTDGVAEDLDTTGGTPSFSTLTGGTNTNALLVGTGGSLGPTGSGMITANMVPSSAGASPTTSATLAYDSTSNTLEAGVNGANKIIAFTDSNISGSAATAATLTTPRTIGGVSFDGSADIVPQTIQVVDSTSATTWVGIFDAQTGSIQPKTDGGLTYNATTAALSATTFIGNLTGNVTGNASGNAGTATALAADPTGCSANQFGTDINASGTMSCAQVAFSQLSGSATDAQIPDSITAINYLPLVGGTMTGQLITSNLGVRYTASDTNPTCIPGNGVYAIFADLSEGKLKKCTDGVAEDLDTTGGTPSFSTITGGTNTNALLIGSGGTFGPTGTGVITTTRVVNSTTLPATCVQGDLYFDTDATSGTRLYICDSTNNWQYLPSLSGSGTGVLTMLEGTAPGAGAAAGEHNVYFDSADSLLKSHENAGSVVTYYSTANPQTTITGNAGSATVLQTSRNIGGVLFSGGADIVPQTSQVVASADTTSFLVMVDSATGNLQPKTNTSVTVNGVTGAVAAASFTGPLTGNVTGNVSGSAATITGSLALANTPLTTRGDLLIATTATPILGRLAKGTQYQVLTGGATEPTWGAVDLAQASAVTGVLPDANIASSIARDAEVAAAYQTILSNPVTAPSALTTDLPVFGNANDRTIKVGTRSGNTTEVGTVSGAKTVDKQVTFDASGNLVASTYDVGAAGGGGGTTGLYSDVLDFGSITDGACAQLTFAATGLATGKTLALSLPSSTPTGVIGIAFASATDTAAVRLCNFSGSAADPASATYKVRDMDSLGYLTASAAIDFGSIPDGSCSSNTLTLTGAATGDNVATGWPSTIETGLIGAMYVSASNTVTVRVCNFSGAAVDPASQTFAAAITR